MLSLLLIFNLFLYKIEKYEKGLFFYIVPNILVILMSIFLWEKYEVNYYIPGTILYIKLNFIINGIFVLFSIFLIKMLLDIKGILKKRNIIVKTIDLKTKQRLMYFMFSLLVFIGLLLIDSSKWAMDYFDGLRIDQIIYCLSQPLKGSDPQQFVKFATGPFLNALLYTMFIIIIYYHLTVYSIKVKRNSKYFSKAQSILLELSPIVGVLIVILSLNKSVTVIGKEDIKTYFFENTSLYEKYYVEPEEVNIKFEKKRT